MSILDVPKISIVLMKDDVEVAFVLGYLPCFFTLHCGLQNNIFYYEWYRASCAFTGWKTGQKMCVDKKTLHKYCCFSVVCAFIVKSWIVRPITP